MAVTRIKIDHRSTGGLTCTDGTRIPVAMLVRRRGAGGVAGTFEPVRGVIVLQDVARRAFARMASRTKTVSPGSMAS